MSMFGLIGGLKGSRQVRGILPLLCVDVWVQGLAEMRDEVKGLFGPANARLGYQGGG